ncbi:hypothetical protein FB566_2657 [Stackebrandtia endophytica]|uniref:VOC domain-containing protein n=1 Tax=Stackebrandtia endophytica TaxID=1496996 RepID=A0A543AX09_9ACTN|nr:VOC family protein [Stackebrandtia endophytica]TQL77107.1 hypothetical protein FB566_2657 [Stackebrandtia endophytica]
MEPRLHFITVATPDLAAARRFYRDGLGWRPVADVPGEIIFLQVGPGLILGLFDAERFVQDVAGAVTDPAITGLTLSHNVDSPARVDEVIEAAVTAGASLVKSPQRADFGGYHGHFADPNGVIWEVCHNPGWRVDDRGDVHFDDVN